MAVCISWFLVLSAPKSRCFLALVIANVHHWPESAAISKTLGGEMSGPLLAGSPGNCCCAFLCLVLCLRRVRDILLVSVRLSVGCAAVCPAEICAG